MNSFDYKCILFLCAANSVQSQMAEALARSYFGGDVDIRSGGADLRPIHPLAIEVMNEIGIDMSMQRAKRVDDKLLCGVDLIVSIGTELIGPQLPDSIPLLHWSIDDPSMHGADTSDDEIARTFQSVREQLKMRINVLKELHEVPLGPSALEFHASIRTPNLPLAARFYTWLLGVHPKEWTHRYVTFVSDKLRTNLVILVDDGKELHQDTLYHLGIEVGTRDAVIECHHSALAAGWHLHKPARTTWRGTPLHELWLKDPGGNLIEIYARLTEKELCQMPADKVPWVLVESQS